MKKMMSLIIVLIIDVFYVGCLTHEEDDELQASRKKVREFNRRNRINKSQEKQDNEGNAGNDEAEGNAGMDEGGF